METTAPDLVGMPGLTLLGDHRGDYAFNSITYDDSLPRPIPCQSSDDTHYIKPNADGSLHVLPYGAVLPILHNDGTWNPPSQEIINICRGILAKTTNTMEILKPEWKRLLRMLRYFKDDHLPEKTPTKDTDFGWLRRNFHVYAGGKKREGWYDGVVFRTQANGINNWHYNQLWWHGVNFILTDDPNERAKQWPFLLEQLIGYACYGRIWFGTDKGMSRDEKGSRFVGDSRRKPFSKFYILNALMGYLLTDRHPLFEKVIRDEAAFWNSNAASKIWRGYWGAREGTRNISNAVYIGLAIPDLRYDMEQECVDMMTQYKTLLDRNTWVWPNLGNGGTAEESPWMQLQVVADILRAWEQFPSTQAYGPSRQELRNVVDTILSDYGSEEFSGYRCVRYRYHTVQTPAFFLSNSAWLLPALRLLDHPMYEHQARLFQEYAGCYLQDVRDSSARPIDDIGARDARNGAAWTKNILTELEAIR